MENFIVAQSPQLEEKTDIKYSFEISLQNKYLWRGISYTDGLVIQPSFTQEAGPWSVQLWGNIVGKDKNNSKMNELDLYINYNFELAGLSVTPSLFYYTYMDDEGSPPTAELSIALDYPIGNFYLQSTFTTDIKEASGYLFSTHNIFYEKEFSEKLTAGANAGIGWGTSKFFEYYLDNPKNSLSYLYAALTASYSLTEFINLNLFAEIYLNTDAELEAFVGGSTHNFGITLSYSF